MKPTEPDSYRSTMLRRISSAIRPTQTPTPERNQAVVEALLISAATVDMSSRKVPYSTAHIEAMADKLLEVLDAQGPEGVLV